MTIPSSDNESRLAASSAAASPEATSPEATSGEAASRVAVSSQEPGIDGDEALADRAQARRRSRRLALHFVVVLCAASALASSLWGARAGLSAALGVGLAGGNLLLMRKITGAMTADGGAGGSAAWALALPFKLVALVGVAYVLVSRGVAQPVPLAMGFALLPLTGVFLPRPTSVPAPSVARQRSRLASDLPRSRRDSMSRRSQPAA